MDFYRIDHHTIMSGHVVRYRPTGFAYDFEISASRDRAMIQGESPDIDAADLADLNAVLLRAVEMSITLRTARESSGFDFANDPPCVIELRKAHFAGDDEIVEQRPRAE